MSIIAINTALPSNRTCNDLGLCQNTEQPCDAKQACARQAAQAAVQAARLRSERKPSFAPGTIEYGRVCGSRALPGSFRSLTRFALFAMLVIGLFGLLAGYIARIMGWA